MLKSAQCESIANTWQDSLMAFRGRGKGGSAARLVAEREAERQREALLIHKDPEFEKVADLKQECLPYK